VWRVTSHLTDVGAVAAGPTGGDGGGWWAVAGGQTAIFRGGAWPGRRAVPRAQRLAHRPIFPSASPGRQPFPEPVGTTLRIRIVWSSWFNTHVLPCRLPPPPVGGRTLFADCTAAYAALSGAEQLALEGVRRGAVGGAPRRLRSLPRVGHRAAGRRPARGPARREDGPGHPGARKLC
jgi:hypothetical protein